MHINWQPLRKHSTLKWLSHQLLLWPLKPHYLIGSVTRRMRCRLSAYWQSHKLKVLPKSPAHHVISVNFKAPTHVTLQDAVIFPPLWILFSSQVSSKAVSWKANMSHSDSGDTNSSSELELELEAMFDIQNESTLWFSCYFRYMC